MPPPPPPSAQEAAIILLALSGIVQMNIILTRNPSFWWHFSKDSAPRPSIILLIPVLSFLLGTTFVCVYWNKNIKPDGPVYLFEGVGECGGAQHVLEGLGPRARFGGRQGALGGRALRLWGLIRWRSQRPKAHAGLNAAPLPLCSRAPPCLARPPPRLQAGTRCC